MEDIFKQNACRLYDMNRVMGSLDSKKASSSNSLSIKSIPPPEDIVFVRILWVDASGQHRCRVSSFAFVSMVDFFFLRGNLMDYFIFFYFVL